MQSIIHFARRHRTALMGANLVLLLFITLISPLEQTLGWKARAVYFHGAWVWTGKIAFALAALAGLAALLLPRMRATAANWSLALGRTGMVFWLTYLPMSLWIQQINWGGIFWDEPRWRVPLAFGVAGVLLQVALVLFDRRLLTAVGNLVFGVGLWWALASIQNVLHPDSPIFGSGALDFEIFFMILAGLSLVFMAQIGLALYSPKNK